MQYVRKSKILHTVEINTAKYGQVNSKLPNINWKLESTIVDTKLNTEVLGTIRELGLNQIINFKSNNKNTLDLF